MQSQRCSWLLVLIFAVLGTDKPSYAQVKIRASRKPAVAESPSTASQQQDSERLRTAKESVRAAKAAFQAAKDALRRAREAESAVPTSQLGYVKRIQAHRRGILALAASPDRETLATAGNDLGVDFQVRVWNLRTGEKLAQLDLPPNQQILAVQFTPDGKYLLTGGVTGQVEVFSTDGYVHLRSLRTSSQFVQCLTFSEDGKTVIVSGTGSTVELWDVTKWSRLHTFDTKMHFVKSVEFTTDGRGAIAAGGFYNNRPSSLDHSIVAWDWDSGQIRYELKADPKSATSWAVEQSDRSVLSFGGDHKLKLWVAGNNTPTRVIDRAGPLDEALLTPDGEHVSLISSSTSDIVFSNLKSGVAVHQTSYDMAQADVAIVAADLQHLILGTHNGWVELVPLPSACQPEIARSRPQLPLRDIIPEVPALAPIRTLEGHSSPIHTMAFVPESDILLSGADNGTLVSWEIKEGVKKNTRPPSREGEMINDIAVSPDGKFAAIASGSGEIGSLILWDIPSWSEAYRLHGHTASVVGVSFAPGNRLVSVGKDKTVRIWNLDSRSQEQILEGVEGVFKATMAPDRGVLATLANEQMTLWETDTLRRLVISSARGRVLEYQPGAGHFLLMSGNTDLKICRTRGGIGGVCQFAVKDIEYAVFSGDGKKVIAAQSGNPVPLVFDVESGTSTHRLTGTSGEILCLSAAQQGRFVAAASSDHKIYVWQLAP